MAGIWTVKFQQERGCETLVTSQFPSLNPLTRKKRASCKCGMGFNAILSSLNPVSNPPVKFDLRCIGTFCVRRAETLKWKLNMYSLADHKINNNQFIAVASWQEIYSNINNILPPIRVELLDSQIDVRWSVWSFFWFCLEPIDLMDCIRDSGHENLKKVKPKHLNSPLMVGCRIGHKPLLLFLNYFRSDLTRAKNSSSPQINFPKDGFFHFR